MPVHAHAQYCARAVGQGVPPAESPRVFQSCHARSVAAVRERHGVALRVTSRYRVIRPHQSPVPPASSATRSRPSPVSARFLAAQREQQLPALLKCHHQIGWYRQRRGWPSRERRERRVVTIEVRETASSSCPNARSAQCSAKSALNEGSNGKLRPTSSAGESGGADNVPP